MGSLILKKSFHFGVFSYKVSGFNFIIGNILFASVGFGAGCSAGVNQLTVINKQKFFFITIHKPPASISFAP